MIKIDNKIAPTIYANYKFDKDKSEFVKIDDSKPEVADIADLNETLKTIINYNENDADKINIVNFYNGWKSMQDSGVCNCLRKALIESQYALFANSLTGIDDSIKKKIKECKDEESLLKYIEKESSIAEKNKEWRIILKSIKDFDEFFKSFKEGYENWLNATLKESIEKINETIEKNIEINNIELTSRVTIMGQGAIANSTYGKIRSNVDKSNISMGVFLRIASDRPTFEVTLEPHEDKTGCIDKNNYKKALEDYKKINSDSNSGLSMYGSDSSKRISYIIWDNRDNTDEKDKKDLSDDFSLEKSISEAINKLLLYYKKCIIDNPVIGKIDAEIRNGFKQIVLTGAPGTGKTYNAEEYAGYYVDNIDKKDRYFKTVQFHPSYDYTDFVEGIRPVSKGSGVDYKKLDGHFKKFCRMVVEDAIEKVGAEIGSKKNQKQILKDIYEWSTKEDPTENEKKCIDIFNGSLNSDSPDYRFFIIDEINRADISKVLGELMYGLEYRGISKRFPTQYQNLKTYDTEEDEYLKFDCFEYGFFIPENIIIIGTMNDIDKSVESFDFAMRRRFQWPEVEAEEVMKYTLAKMYANISEESLNDLVNKINGMNNEIHEGKGKEYRLSKAYHIGPGYFKNLIINDKGEYDNDVLKSIYYSRIAPLLREYVRGLAEDGGDELVKKCGMKLLKDSNN